MKTTILIAILALALTSCGFVHRVSHKETTKLDTSAHVETVDKSKIVVTEKAKVDTILPADTISHTFVLPPVDRPFVIENDLTKTIIENDGNGFKATTIAKPRHIDIDTEKTTVEDRDVKTSEDLHKSEEKTEQSKEVEKKPSPAAQIGSFLASFWYLWLILLAYIVWRFGRGRLF